MCFWISVQAAQLDNQKGSSAAKTPSHGCNLIKVGSRVIRASNATVHIRRESARCSINGIPTVLFATDTFSRPRSTVFLLPTLFSFYDLHRLTFKHSQFVPFLFHDLCASAFLHGSSNKFHKFWLEILHWLDMEPRFLHISSSPPNWKHQEFIRSNTHKLNNYRKLNNLLAVLLEHKHEVALRNFPLLNNFSHPTLQTSNINSYSSIKHRRILGVVQRKSIHIVSWKWKPKAPATLLPVVFSKFES